MWLASIRWNCRTPHGVVFALPGCERGLWDEADLPGSKLRPFGVTQACGGIQDVMHYMRIW